MDISRGDTSSGRDILLISTILEGFASDGDRKRLSTFEMVFPFVAVFINQATGIFQQAPRTSFHTIYYALEGSLMR